ncbi:MAG: LLM class flavin-dependent oxidoreductase [Proteobacteria bacterium]|nr:LLM class flavin-dependent oxidoreductase [Pseudomonadota bacterium]
MSVPARRARLGVVLSTVTAGPPQEFVDIGRLAEQHGFDSVFVNEGRGDALACAQAIASATRELTVGTNIANIYFRHPFLAASTCRTIAELHGGRLRVGFGMSHRGLLGSLGIDMGDARSHLRDYVAYVQDGLAGRAGSGFLQQPASSAPVRVYVAANTVESAAVAGEVGDGLMPFLSPMSYLPRLVAAARDSAARHARALDECTCVLSIPTFISDDADAALSAARYNLAFFALLPNYRRQWRRAGFGAAMDAIRALGRDASRAAAVKHIPDELVREVCVFGSAAQCRAQLDAFRAAGADLPVIAVSPVNEDRLVATRKAIVALA